MASRAFALVMKRTDPSIRLISCGQSGLGDWDEIVLRGLAELVDYHSIHLIRHCRTVRNAAFAQLVNAIAPIFTSPRGLFLQTIYHPLRLYAEHTREVALDAAATSDASGQELTLSVVNRDRDQELVATIDLGAAEGTRGVDVAEVNGPDVTATNSFGAPRQVDVRERRLDVGGQRFEYAFPAHSVTVLGLRLA